MTYGIIIDGIKYIYLMNDNDFKKKSLYDNVYFTLRDIFANAESSDTVIEANGLNHSLINGISFAERRKEFQYSNVLQEKYFVERLQSWLKHFDIYCFDFEEPDDYEKNDMKKYMKLDDWWLQFEELRNLIDKQYEKCCR